MGWGRGSEVGWGREATLYTSCSSCTFVPATLLQIDRIPVVVLTEDARLLVERILRHARELGERPPWEELEAELEGPTGA